MKIQSTAILLVALTLAVVRVAGAEETAAGKWKAEFDTQIGVQKYTFEFKVDGTNLTGKAVGERVMGTNEVVITEGKVNQDEISFVEPLKWDEMELRIEYKGKLSGDEIKFTRKVGDAATEELVAKRVKETEPKPEAKPEIKPEAKAETNSQPAKP